jgi:1,4-alpha-glucan branching enzyme
VHYGGSGWGNLGGIEAQPVPAHGMPWTLTVAIPPLGCLFFGLG